MNASLYIGQQLPATQTKNSLTLPACVLWVNPNKHGFICNLGYKFQIWGEIWDLRPFGGCSGLWGHQKGFKMGPKHISNMHMNMWIIAVTESELLFVWLQYCQRRPKPYKQYAHGYIFWVTYFKSEVRSDLWGCLEAIAASEAAKRVHTKNCPLQ